VPAGAANKGAGANGGSPKVPENSTLRVIIKECQKIGFIIVTAYSSYIKDFPFPKDVFWNREKESGCRRNQAKLG
jgi:hypothetical protein